MIRRALKMAIGPSIGATIGVMGFRLLNRHLYNDTWPSLWIQAAICLVVGYAASFLVALLIEGVQGKLRRGD